MNFSTFSTEYLYLFSVIKPVWICMKIKKLFNFDNEKNQERKKNYNEIAAGLMSKDDH